MGFGRSMCALFLDVLTVIGIAICIVFPEWVYFYNDRAGDDKADETAGLWVRCTVGSGTRWEDCWRHPYLDKPWYILVQVLYVICFVLSVMALVGGYLAHKHKRTTRMWYGTATSMTFFTLGTQIVVLGLYGGHVDADLWCIEVDEQPCVELHLPDYDTGIAPSFGWTYWFAVGVAFISLIDTLLYYHLMNNLITLHKSRGGYHLPPQRKCVEEEAV